MKVTLTKGKIRQIIREELEKLSEADMYRGDDPDEFDMESDDPVVAKGEELGRFITDELGDIFDEESDRLMDVVEMIAGSSSAEQVMNVLAKLFSMAGDVEGKAVENAKDIMKSASAFIEATEETKRDMGSDDDEDSAFE